MSLSSVPDDIDLKIKNENKEANLQSEIYSPILLELSVFLIKLENLINDTPLSSNLRTTDYRSSFHINYKGV